MAMKFKNNSKKVIGIGDVTILPGETQDIPKAYENNPVLEYYKKKGFAEITGKPSKPAKTAEQIAAEKEAAAKKAAEEAEKLRLARLASLEGISNEALAALANEIGINPADCKDQKDVLAKVKAALEK